MSNKEEKYKIVYLKTKTKTRKIVTYKDNDKLSIRIKHEKINVFLEENLIQSNFSYAYRKHRSIYDNARVHLINNYFVKLDIEKFFNNISLNKLADILDYELNKSIAISKKEVKNIIEVCSVYKKGLPLGLINSPILANIYLKEFDSLFYGSLKKIADNYGVKNILFTRYADDLTISFKEYTNIVALEKVVEEIEESAKRNLAKYFLKLNDNKTTFINLSKSNHVRITGISITLDDKGYRRISVGRKRIRNLYLETLRIYELYETSQKSTIDEYEIQKLSGMESFILSIEKQGYSKKYSKGMVSHLETLGFSSLGEMISYLIKKSKK